MIPTQLSGATGSAAPTSGAAGDDELRQLARVRADLVHEFAGRLGEDEVQRRFAASVQQFEGAPIRSFVPVLAQRRARLDLQAAPLTPAAPE